jgi:hypothetical protein
MSISTSAVRAPLHHRPFAVLGQHLEHADPAPAAGVIRAEVRALVSRRAISRRDGDDAATAWTAARTRLVADLDHLYGICLDTLRLHRTCVRRLSDHTDHTDHTDLGVPDAA